MMMSMSQETRRSKEPFAEHRTAQAGIIFGFFLFGIIVPIVFNNLDWYTEMRSDWARDIQYLVHPAFRMIVVLVGWLLLIRINNKNQRPSMGILIGWAPALTGMLIGFLCSIPMFILGFICDRKPVDHELIYSTIVPGFTEEVFYRAFAFGLMVQVLKFKIWPAAVLTGLLFGLAHLINASVRSQPIGDEIGWIALIAVGGLLYAWIYERANWNLWVVIMLHASMNLWWDVFDLSRSSLGDWGATLSRVLAIGLAIYFVVFRGLLRPTQRSSWSTIES